MSCGPGRAGSPPPHAAQRPALLAIGLGAGLTSEEIQRLVGADIRVEGDDLIVDVIGKDRRQVPVLPEWAPEVWGFARESGAHPYFSPERSCITRRDIIGFIERASVDKAEFCIQRLRITWVVHHLSAGTHMLLLERWSGVRAGQLVKYLKYATLPNKEYGAAFPLRAGFEELNADGGDHS